MKSFARFTIVICFFFALQISNFQAIAELVDFNKPTLRYPEKIFLTSDHSHLITANRKSGTLSKIDLNTKAVQFEAKIAERIIDALLIKDHSLLVLDDETDQLLLVKIGRTDCEILDAISVPTSPSGIAIDDNHIYVASKWPRKLSHFQLNNKQIGKDAEITLPFSPRKILPVVQQQKLLVSDAFSGRVAVIDQATFKLEHVRKFPAHNIRGMQLSADKTKVVFIHQMLNDLAVTNKNDIHWGLLMSNDARWLPINKLLDPKADFYKQGHMQPIGEANQGGGDPSAIEISSSGVVALTMAATNEFAIGKELQYGLFRTKVGQRPSDLVFDEQANRAYVANSFDDTISVVDTKRHEVIETISLGPQRKLDLAEQGEVLFHKGLSMEGWMSCNSCHIDGHTNGQANDNFSDNSFGAPKRVLSLLGKKDTAPFGWLAVSETFAEQSKKSVQKTMLGKAITDQQANALAAYLNTLELPKSLDTLQNNSDTAAINRGKQLFHLLQCSNCHIPPNYTSAGVYDVGLHDKLGNKEFNPPSLRGISHRERLFHDLRANTLKEVFTVHKHQIKEELTNQQLHDLIHFLRSL